MRPYLKPYGIAVEIAKLDAGDVAFVGNGPNGDVSIGIERKVITDLVQCIRDRRLSGFQLIGSETQPGLLESYDYVYLVIEGIFKAGDKGVLYHYRHDDWEPLYLGSSPVLFLEVDSFLSSLELRAVTRIGEPVRVHRTGTIRQTAAHIATLYDNWTGKRWDQHHAHQDIYTRAPQIYGRKASFVKPTINLVVKMAAQLQGVHSKAMAIGKKFKTPIDMVQATEKDWASIDGIGKVLAKRIRADLGHTNPNNGHGREEGREKGPVPNEEPAQLHRTHRVRKREP